MFLHRTPSAVIVQAPAKLNLHFEVLARRADGYHDVETIIAAIDLFDTLIIRRWRPEYGQADGRGIRFQACWAAGLRTRNHLHPKDGEREAAMGDLPKGSDNLVVRALELLARRSGVRVSADIRLVKRIPSASGLGGGSSDAAAALLAANELLELHWSRGQLARVAAELGSDVPFFLSSGTAICRGRGEQIKQVSWMPLNFVVVRPPLGLETKQVYAQCSPPDEPVSPQPLLDALRAGDPIQVGRRLMNRLEEPAARLMPSIRKLRSLTDRLNFPGHQMTGSGSSYFAVCRTKSHARRAANHLRGCRLGHVFSAASICSPSL